MKYWVIALLVLTTLVISGGCSSSAPVESTALAPAGGAAGSGTRNASSLIWGSPVVVDSTDPLHNVGASLAIIAGNPAVSYQLWSDQGPEAGFTVYYARANDPAGTSWGSATAVDFWPFPHQYNMYTSLCEVNGRPAIGYNAMPNGSAYNDLRYIRAKNPVGSKWGNPVIVDPYDDDWFDFQGEGTTMEIVNGNPAIWYRDAGKGKYVRALDQNGNNWGQPVYPDPLGSGFSPSFAIVNGCPAVTYTENGDLRFLRAADANGDTWGSPQTVLAGLSQYHVNQLAVVDGNPAIAFSGDDLGPTATYVRFIRALDTDGTSWPSAAIEVTTSGDGTNRWLGRMAVINGLPSIVFTSGINIAVDPPPAVYDELNLNFVQALDPGGSAWETAETIANLGPVYAGQLSPALAVVGSGAGVAFTDDLYAVTYLGTLPAPPDPAVNVQLSTDKSAYAIGEDTEAVLTAVVTDEYGDPISGLGAGAFATTLDGGGVTVTFSESATAGTYTGSLDITGLTAGDHTLQTTVTDTRAVSGSGSATFSMNEPGVGGTMHVGDLDASIQAGPHNRWRVVFTVKIDDSSENPVSSADVSFSYSGADSGNGQITTGGDGTASYQTGWIQGSGSLTFTVDDVTHATLTYSSDDNHDPDGDSDGTSIEITG